MAKENSSSVLIVGAGHVGLVTAVGLAKLGHRVTALDKNPALVGMLSNGEVPFMEPGLSELLDEMLAAGRLSFASAYENHVRDAEFVFLCVNTPSTVSGAADLRYVRDAASCIGQEMARTGNKPIIVNKSTSPIGTAETIEMILRSHLTDEYGPPLIASNPEFLREGSAVQDFLAPERIVVGCEEPGPAERVAKLYNGIEAPVILTDLRSAELIKYVSNAFLATRVSFINEVARLCGHLGVDIDTIADGAGMDSRIGRQFFSAGIGYGGSCLPKDVDALRYTGDLVGASTRLLTAVQEVNLSQRRFVVQRLKASLGSLEGRTLGIWGLTFKGGSEDLRESPALDIVRLLRNEGARVKVFDPAIDTASGLEIVDEICPDAESAACDANAVVVLTDWREFACVDFGRVSRLMAGDLIYDGRNVLERKVVEASGLHYEGIGRPMRSPSKVEGTPAAALTVSSGAVA